ncbi:hypothetical protein NEMBOFW57_009208 [Staphylotrichum longicolle]|uniref:Heterokaryon incompatibility domain-containing protein n=1 Tax=Staphylotrichum longicolle TaxID=669026 RepID=A0AAD4ESN3_9PEZI|nr:hypothetical protein NEMBOFW57_009208 [Staphylotrichum longicolle]
MKRNGRKALSVYRTEYIRSEAEKAKWKAHRDDPIEVVHDAQLSVSTGSAASFGLAKQWLTRCKRGHSVCRDAIRSVTKFPTRLLDIGSGKVKTIRLREGRGQKDFVSLSHCWGSLQPLRLLEGNLELFKTQINFEDLPRTFQDAVTITRELGYRYLWIDSLCIIQDSKGDWTTESAIMGHIYRASALNISAGGAADSSAGCFATRNPLKHRACILTGDAASGLCIPRRCPSEWRDHDGSSTISRGWVFQERMLAPRTLHYSRRTISWECIRRDATEGWPDGADTWDWKSNGGYSRPKEIFQALCDFRPPAKTAATSPLTNKDVLGFLRAWDELVATYSGKALTQRGDKLVALHGIMSMIAQSTGLRHGAGLWLDYLAVGLMWRTWRAAPTRPESLDKSQYRAPSWSWACVDSNVRLERVMLQMDYHDFTQQFRVENIAISALPNGQVSRGELVVRGRLRRMEWGEFMAGMRHDGQGRKERGGWSPDFEVGASTETWGLLLMTRIGSSAASANHRVDVIMALDKVKGDKEWTFLRAGYVTQSYWQGETHCVFHDDREEVNETIYII